MKLLFKPACFLLGILASLVLVWFSGESPWLVLKTLFLGSLGSVSALSYTLFFATPLIFTGLSVALAARAGLFNIGAEGQLYVGTLFLTLVGIYFPNNFLSPIWGIVAALVGGAFWGSLAGSLKAYRKSHEVVVTIMLNFIALAVCGYFIHYVIKNLNSANPESSEIGSHFQVDHLIPTTFFYPANVAFLIAVIFALVVHFLLMKTNWGYEVRLLGASPKTALYSGIDVKKRMVEVMAVSGALAGLVGVNEVMGFSHKFKDQFSPGYGFMGIAVALLAGNRPLGVIVSALVFGMIQKGSLELEFESEKITRDISSAMLGVIILAISTEKVWIKMMRGKNVPGS